MSELNEILQADDEGCHLDLDGEEDVLVTKRELAKMELAKATKIILRARANWASQGERPSKYFLNMQKRKSKNRTL